MVLNSLFLGKHKIAEFCLISSFVADNNHVLLANINLNQNFNISFVRHVIFWIERDILRKLKEIQCF